MGNGYNQHLHHQNLHQLNHKQATFLPMLCSKPSIKDVTLPKWKHRSAADSPSESDDPLSPKISCMGQVKRNNNRILIGFPASHKLTFTTTTTTTKNSCNNNNGTIKYFKLKKLFSGKNLTSSSPAAVAAAATSCRRREVLINSTSRAPKNGDGKENSASNSINIENMDPPLPVIKRTVPQNDEKGDGDTLWGRRFRGVALKSLQLQQIQLNRHQEPTTV